MADCCSMCAFNVIMWVLWLSLVRKCHMTQTWLILCSGDTIPHVIALLLPSTTDRPFLALLVDRRFVILLATLTVSFPLSLHRDIVKLSKSSGFGE